MLSVPYRDKQGGPRGYLCRLVRRTGPRDGLLCGWGGPGAGAGASKQEGGPTAASDAIVAYMRKEKDALEVRLSLVEQERKRWQVKAEVTYAEMWEK